MADITMCNQPDCPRHQACYRYMARPSILWQSYFACDPREADGSCDEFLPLRYRKQQDED